MGLERKIERVFSLRVVGAREQITKSLRIIRLDQLVEPFALLHPLFKLLRAFQIRKPGPFFEDHLPNLPPNPLNRNMWLHLLALEDGLFSVEH